MVSHLKHPFDRSEDTQQEPKQSQAMMRNKVCGHTAGAANNIDSVCKERPRDHTQTVPSKNTITLVLPKWLFCYFPIAIVVVSVIISIGLTSRRQYIQESFVLEKSDAYGWETVDIFSEFDLDEDFSLSFDEAVPLLLQYLGKTKDIAVNSSIFQLSVDFLARLRSVVCHLNGHNDSLSPDVDSGEDVVTIEAKFSPLNLSTMTKDWGHDIHYNESFYGLFNWLTPHIKTKDFGVSRFLDLLPDLESNPAPGTVYTIVEAPTGMFASSNLPSNRFYPPRVVGRGSFINRLLSMLHPRPFLLMRFPPQGILGCVRAVNKEFIEVVFRMHIEFQLNEPPRFPFWFTPAQFTGSLRMSRNGSRLEHFHLYVPGERRLNVDMEWLNENPDDMEVDIGYLPLMELVSAGHSRPQRLFKEGQVHEAENQSYSEENTRAEIKWDAEISYEDAKDALELKMYPFKQAHAADSTLPYSSIAQSFVDMYEFPVMMLVALSNGTVVHKINANDFLDMEVGLMEGGFSEPSAHSYVRFLREGIKKGEEIMQKE